MGNFLETKTGHQFFFGKIKMDKSAFKNIPAHLSECLNLLNNKSM
jgi:hypothetical protein